MPKKIIWSEEQIEEIVARYLKQETTREIAKVYKCSKKTISDILKKNDIELISRRTLNKKPPRKPRKIIDKTGNIYGKLTVIKRDLDLKTNYVKQEDKCIGVNVHVVYLVCW